LVVDKGSVDDGLAESPPYLGVFSFLRRGDKMEPVVLKELLLLEDLSPAIEAVPSLHPADVAEGLKDVPFEQQLRFIN